MFSIFKFLPQNIFWREHFRLKTLFWQENFRHKAHFWLGNLHKSSGMNAFEINKCFNECMNIPKKNDEFLLSKLCSSTSDTILCKNIFNYFSAWEKSKQRESNKRCMVLFASKNKHIIIGSFSIYNISSKAK